MVGDGGCERIHKEKKGKGMGAEICSCTSPEGLGLWAFIGNGVAVEQDVSVRLQLVSMLSLRAGSHVLVVCYVLFHKFLEPLHLQGASSNFLVLRIKTNRTVRANHAWGSSQLWERELEKVASILLCT